MCCSRMLYLSTLCYNWINILSHNCCVLLMCYLLHLSFESKKKKAVGNWIRRSSGDQADYRSYYLLQDRGPDMTPPYSETSQREEETDRQEVRGTRKRFTLSHNKMSQKILNWKPGWSWGGMSSSKHSVIGWDTCQSSQNIPKHTSLAWMSYLRWE